MSLCFFVPRFEEGLIDLDPLERALLGSVKPRQQCCASGQLSKIIDDQSRLAISLDVSKFNPEELNVNVEGRTLTVEGKQEIEEENGYSIRSFMRQWTLPEDVDIDNIRSSLTEDGHLSIEAPKANPPAAALKPIPIQKAAKKE